MAEVGVVRFLWWLSGIMSRAAEDSALGDGSTLLVPFYSKVRLPILIVI